MSSPNSITGRTVLITGANRGLGKALLEDALRRDAHRVYAATRRPYAHPDPRVTPLVLDVTDAAQIDAAARAVAELDVLINNAGIWIPDGLGERDALERHLAVNLFGTYAVTHAFQQHLTRSRGVIINVLSLASLAAVPVSPAYSISKAAAFSFTQTIRALLAQDGVRVHAVLPGPIDTDMVRDLPVPKADPQQVARAILDAVAVGTEDIFPDSWSEPLAEGWPSGAVKTLERDNAALLAQLR